MARKEKLKTNEFDLDSGLGDFDFDFDLDSELDQEAKQPKKRSVIGNVFKGALGGIKDTATSPSFIKQTLERSLPDTYGEVTGVAGEMATGMYELYDETVKEVKPRLGRISKKLDQLVPDSAPKLKKLTQKLMDATGADRDSDYASTASQEDQAVTTALGAIFEQNRQYTQDGNKKSLLKDTIDAKRFDQSSGLLSVISRNTAIQAQYTTNVTQAYQKKMLELTLRSYLGQREHFRYTEKYMEGFRVQHEAIIKNTSLPEYAKITNWERVKEEGKKRMTSKLYGEGSFIQRGIGRLKDSARELVSGATMSLDNLDFALDEALSGQETVDQMNEMLTSMGEEPLTKAEMAGATASAEGINWVRDKVAKRLKARAQKNPKIVNGLAKAARIAMNPGGAIQTLRKTSKWDAGVNDYQSKKGSLYRFADYLLSHFEEGDPSRQIKAGTDLNDLDGPSKGFSNKAHITLVDVIPGHLAAIHREIAMMRTGRDDVPSRIFDFGKNEFVDRKEMSKRVQDDLKKEIKGSGHDYYLGQAAKDFAGDDKLTDDQELEMKRFLGRLARIPDFDLEPENIRNTDAYDKLHPSIQALVDKKLTAMETADDKEVKKTDLTRHVVKVRKNVPSLDASFKKFVDAGYGDILESTGLVKRNEEGHYDVDEERYAEYLERNSLVRSDMNVKQAIQKLNPGQLLQTVADRFKGPGNTTGKLDWRGKQISPLSPEGALGQIKDRLSGAKDSLRSKYSDLKDQLGDRLDPANLSGGKKWSPEGAFDAFKKTKLYNWTYQKGKGDQQPHSGPMAQEVNKNFGEEAAPGGKAIDLQSMNGAAMAAIKFLGEKVDGMKKAWVDRSTGSEDATVEAQGQAKGKGGSSILAKIEQNTRGLLTISQKAMLGQGRGRSRRQGGAIGPQLQGGFIGAPGDDYGSMVGGLAKNITDLGMKISKDGFSAVEKIFGFGKDKIASPFTKFIGEKWKDNKDGFKKGFGSVVDKAIEVGGSILDFGKRIVDTHLPAGFKQVKLVGQKVLNKLTEKFYEARDLYLPDGTEPVLRATKMRAGEYYDKASGQVIKTLEDLNKAKGDIVDKAGNIILSLEEKAKGLYDAHGNKVKSFLGAIANSAMEAGSWLKDKATGLFGSLKDKSPSFKGMFEGVQDFFGSGFGDFTGVAKESQQVLVDIRSILLGEEADVRKRLKLAADKATKVASDASAASEGTEKPAEGDANAPAEASLPNAPGGTSSGGLISQGLSAGRGFFDKHFGKDAAGQRPSLKDKVKEGWAKLKDSKAGKIAMTNPWKDKLSSKLKGWLTPSQALDYRNRIGKVGSEAGSTLPSVAGYGGLGILGASTAYGQGYDSMPVGYTGVGGAASAPMTMGHILAEGTPGLSPAEMGAATALRDSPTEAKTPRESLMGAAQAKWNKLKGSKLGQATQAKYEKAKHIAQEERAKKLSLAERAKHARDALKARVNGALDGKPDYRAQTSLGAAPTTSVLPGVSSYGGLGITSGTTGYGQAGAPSTSAQMTATTAPGGFGMPRNAGQGAVPSVAQPVQGPLSTQAARPGMAKRLLGAGKGLMGKAGGLLGGAAALAGGLLGGGNAAQPADATNEAERARALGEHAKPTIIQRIKQTLAPKDRAWNDKDGDGSRDGGVQGEKEKQEDRKASRNKDAAQADLSIRYKNGGDLFGDIKDKLGSIFGLVTSGLSGMFGMASSLLGMIPGAGKLLGKGVGLAKNLLGGTAKLAQSGLGRVLPGALRMGAGMYARALGFSLFTALPTVVSAGVGLAGSALTGIASAILTTPVLGALAIAGAGYGLWWLYKWARRDSANDFEKIRLRQYGFAFNSEVHRYNHHVYGLEAYLQDGRVGYKQGQAYIIERKCKPEDMAELFDIDKDDKESAEKFAYWYDKRFKPFFLTHLTALYTADPKCELKDAIDLEGDKKLQYLQASLYSDGPYDVNVSPLKAIAELSTDKEAVVNAVKGFISRIQDELTKKGKKVDLPKREPGTAQAPTDKDAKAVAPPMDAALKAAQEKDTKTGGVDALKQTLVEREDNKPSAAADPMEKTDTKSPSAVPMAEGSPLSGSGGSKFVKLDKGVDINGLDSRILQYFMGMAEEYGQKTGNSISVNSGRRSTEKQAALHAADPKKAAPPGKSLHEFGLALDIQPSDADKLEKLGLMKKYGFTRPIGGEPWHIEPAGIQKNIALAKSDERRRAEMIDASLYRGGGGYGTDPSAPKYKRNQELALKLLELPPSPAGATADQKKDIVTPGQVLQGKEDAKVAVSTPTGAATSTPSSSGGASPKAANDASFAKSSTGSNTNSLPSPPESEGKPGSGGGGMSMSMTEGGKGGDIKAIISENSKKAGVDPSLMVAFAAMESELNPNAKAPGGSAAGLFQFMPKTWQEQLSTHGKKYGLDPSTTPFDPKAATLLAGEYVKTNSAALRGIAPNPGPVEMYLAHMLGAGGAQRFLKTGKSEVAAVHFQGPAKNNRSIFYSSDGKALTIGEVYAGIEKRMTERAGRYGINVAKSGQGLKMGGGETGITPSSTPSSGTPAKDSGSNPDLSSSGPKKDTPSSAPTQARGSGAAPSSNAGKGLVLPESAPVRQEAGQTFSGPSKSDLAPLLDKTLEYQKSMDSTLKEILENVRTEKVAQVLSAALAAISKDAKASEQPSMKEQDKLNMGRVSQAQPASLDLRRKTV